MLPVRVAASSLLLLLLLPSVVVSGGTYPITREMQSPPWQLPQPAPDVTDACSGVDPAERGRSGGDGDATFPSLTWAALKTGYRLVVAWQGDAPAVGELVFAPEGGPASRLSGTPAPTREHVFVLDGLTAGSVLCFQARETSAAGPAASRWHAVRLANAYAGPLSDDGVYTVHALVLATQGAYGRAILEEGLRDLARRMWDASDGRIRMGHVVLLVVGPEQQNTGMFSCGIGFPMVVSVPGADLRPEHYTIDPYRPTCRRAADVILTHDLLPWAVGATTADGIARPSDAIWITPALTVAAAPLQEHERLGYVSYPIGAVFAHEMAHYALGITDLYDEDAGCDDPVTDVSIVGRRLGATELDDEVARCPDEALLAGYVPSWTVLRRRYSAIPDRAGPDPGPSGDGGAFTLRTFGPADP